MKNGELTKAEESRRSRLRKRDHALAGLWAGKAKAKRGVIHAVGVPDDCGKRTGACGLAGRFIPDSMGTFRTYDDTPYTARCELCQELLRGAKP